MTVNRWPPDRIRALRKRYGESQAIWHRRIGVSADSIRLYEQGRQVPSEPVQKMFDRLEEDIDAGRPREISDGASMPVPAPLAPAESPSYAPATQPAETTGAA